VVCCCVLLLCAFLARKKVVFWRFWPFLCTNPTIEQGKTYIRGSLALGVLLCSLVGFMPSNKPTAVTRNPTEHHSCDMEDMETY
jgi:hypothetical protein